MGHRPKDLPAWQAPDDSRRMDLLVCEETCDAKDICAGLFWLHPGHETEADVHPESAEIYYVVSGSGRLVMDGEEYRVSRSQTVYIPAGVDHQAYERDEDLCYFYAFAAPPPGKTKQEQQGRNRIQ